MISCIFSLFSFQVLNKSGLEILEILLFLSLALSDWYSIWCIKYARIPVCTYLHWDNCHLFLQLVRTLKYYVFRAQMWDQMVLYICIFFLVLIDVDSYFKVYPYFAIVCAKCVQDWEAIIVIILHGFILW